MEEVKITKKEARKAIEELYPDETEGFKRAATRLYLRKANGGSKLEKLGQRLDNKVADLLDGVAAHLRQTKGDE